MQDPAGGDEEGAVGSIDSYPPLADTEPVELIETSTFTRQINSLLSDEEYGGFQSRIAANPELGALIKGGGGIRKVRVAVELQSRLCNSPGLSKRSLGSETTDV